jgi:hypothetical protein
LYNHHENSNINFKVIKDVLSKAFCHRIVAVLLVFSVVESKIFLLKLFTMSNGDVTNGVSICVPL